MDLFLNPAINPVGCCEVFELSHGKPLGFTTAGDDFMRQVRLHKGPLSDGFSVTDGTIIEPQGEVRCVFGTQHNDGRSWAERLTASGNYHGALRTLFHGR